MTIRRKRPTDTLVARIKRDAKAAARSGIADHTSGLETAALAAGYASWHELQQANQRHNAEAHPPDAQPESVPPPTPATGLIVDPVLPDSFDNTPNERRSRKELGRWWDRPFALSNEDGTFEVRCLDGGAWDRATYYGTAVSLEEAATLARDKLARWQRMRAEPVVMIDGPSTFRVAIMPQRPGEKPTVLRTCASGEEASQYLAAYKGAA